MELYTRANGGQPFLLVTKLGSKELFDAARRHELSMASTLEYKEFRGTQDRVDAFRAEVMEEEPVERPYWRYGLMLGT